MTTRSEWGYGLQPNIETVGMHVALGLNFEFELGETKIRDDATEKNEKAFSQRLRSETSNSCDFETVQTDESEELVP